MMSAPCVAPVIDLLRAGSPDPARLCRPRELFTDDLTLHDPGMSEEQR